MKGTSPIAAKKGESASSKKKFKGLLCFDVASGVSPGVCECVQNAANAFSHLQYGYNIICAVVAIFP